MTKIKILNFTNNTGSTLNSFFESGDLLIDWLPVDGGVELGAHEFFVLLNGKADGLLVPQEQMIYPLHEEIAVVSLIENKESTNENFVLLSLALKAKLFNKFNIVDKRDSFGKVYIAGFGPGDPELLTLKTNRLLHEADIIFYDDLLDSTHLDQFNVEKHYVGKRKGKHSAKQETINEKLYTAAFTGKVVVRLKGGDPLVFGRGGEEYHYLKQRFIDAEIVPGITSALAAAADGVIPLTSRGISTSVAFTLGHDAIYNKLPNADTLVFYMGAAQQKKWASRLIDQGWLANTPVAAVRNASLPNKEIKRYTLGELVSTQHVLSAPCLVIVGNTASHDIRAQGKKWLYTGSNINDFKEPGIVTHNPMIAFKTLAIDESTKAKLKNISQYHRILFPSPIAVHKFFNALFTVRLDVRELQSVKLTSMGVSTSTALKKYGLIVNPETDTNSSEAIIQKFKTEGVSNEHILIPCSTQGLRVIPNGLKLMNNKVDALSFYKNELPENVVKHNLEDFYGVVFSSPTTVHNFFKVYDYFPNKLQFKSNGNLTNKIINEYLIKIEENIR